jgi:hypothetical protein
MRRSWIAGFSLMGSVVRQLLARAGADWSLVQRLDQEGLLFPLEYRGHRFYGRGFPARRR